jgi:UDP-N-acetylglucosamine 2-epimerase (non-hydrolysing)
MKTVVTITGIRPDFIRMAEIFKKLDKNFNHILIHTGQHFDKMLSDVFFEELNIRKPDYNLQIGGIGKEHYHQTADVSVKVIELLKGKNIKPDAIMFLGDSNSVTVAPVLKKEGYKIIHIESGMRSFANYMPEEINRKVCDVCTDIFFVYHENYKNNLLRENVKEEQIFVVGNTVVEPVNKIYKEISKQPKTKDFIIMDIHRHNNIISKYRLEKILKYGNICKTKYNCPVLMLDFKRTFNAIKDYGLKLDGIEKIPLLSYVHYIKTQYNAKFIISDSGTAPEECSILKTKVICPRNETERWEAVENGSCYMLSVETEESWSNSFNWLNSNSKIYDEWLGDGTTSDKIINILKEKL